MYGKTFTNEIDAITVKPVVVLKTIKKYSFPMIILLNNICYLFIDLTTKKIDYNTAQHLHRIYWNL